MNDETRKLLKIFGVAVTDFEAEAEKLAAAAAQLSPDSSRDQVAKLMKDAAELSRELNARWLEITQRVFALQERLLSALRRGGREGAVIGRTASRISSSLTGLAPVMSIVGLVPIVGSFSDSRFVPGWPNRSSICCLRASPREARRTCRGPGRPHRRSLRSRLPPGRRPGRRLPDRPRRGTHPGTLRPGR